MNTQSTNFVHKPNQFSKTSITQEKKLQKLFSTLIQRFRIPGCNLTIDLNALKHHHPKNTHQTPILSCKPAQNPNFQPLISGIDSEMKMENYLANSIEATLCLRQPFLHYYNLSRAYPCVYFLFRYPFRILWKAPFFKKCKAAPSSRGVAADD